MVQLAGYATHRDLDNGDDVVAEPKGLVCKEERAKPAKFVSDRMHVLTVA
jgi:hypothetical protein